MGLRPERNKYDLIVITLLASMAFGGIGGALQVSRLLTIIFLPLFIKKFQICKRGTMSYIYFSYLLIAYSSLSLLWTSDFSEGVKELIYFCIHFLFFFEILFFSKLAVNPKESITKGWMFAVILTLIVAIWEISTDNHLSYIAHNTEGDSNIDGVVFKHKFAAVTFFNYNSYVTFLCLALPFIYYRIMDKTKISFRVILPIIVILLSCFCILCNASRGGLLTIIVMLLIYILRQPKSFTKVIILCVIAGIVAFVFIQYGELFFTAITTRSSSGLLEDSSRAKIWGAVFRTFKSTLGLGTGIGGGSSSMSEFTSGIIVPHNLYLEVLLEFGILIFIPFITYIMRLYYTTLTTKNRELRNILYISLLPLPIYSIIDSRYILNYWVFAYFASITFFIKSTEINSNHKLK